MDFFLKVFGFLPECFWRETQFGVSTQVALSLHYLELYLGREQQSRIPTLLMAVDVG